MFVVNSFKAAASLALSAAAARSSIAFASAAVPDCRALANSALKDRLKVTAVNAQKVLFMCSPP
jgi:hypothetical protein